MATWETPESANSQDLRRTKTSLREDRYWRIKSVCLSVSHGLSVPQVDKFTIEAVDLGQIFKIHIRHDNSMMGAEWYLDQVEVLDVETEEVYMFLCERWLSRKKEDKRLERTFFVKVCQMCMTAKRFLAS